MSFAERGESAKEARMGFPHTGLKPCFAWLARAHGMGTMWNKLVCKGRSQATLTSSRCFTHRHHCLAIMLSKRMVSSSPPSGSYKADHASSRARKRRKLARRRRSAAKTKKTLIASADFTLERSSSMKD